jgi:exodeoxyribonuclease VII large subunit
MGGQLQLSLPERRVKALTVTQLVRSVRETLELNLEECWVVGEISNARVAPSDHLYFTLKDSRSSINVVMFRTAGQKLRFKINDGMEVMVRGRVNLYEARGALQFYAEDMEPRGLGALQLAFEQLKERLGAEGLFDQSRKRPLPFLPRKVGLVTALGGAALRDVLTTIFGRYPNVHVIVRAAKVQGDGAAFEIVEALGDLNRHAQVDVIVVTRGGGSLEDLWAFNEEVVARAICRSRIPVISAVGHEIDYTIADFVADARAATPTAAGQLVVPRKAELKQRLREIETTMAGALSSVVAANRRHIDHLASRVKDPGQLLREARQNIDECTAELKTALGRILADRKRHLHLLAGRLAGQIATPSRVLRRELENTAVQLEAVVKSALARKQRHLEGLAARLDSLSPLRVLGRGYAVAINSRNGKAVLDAADVEIGDDLEVRVNRGRLRSRVLARET